MSQIETTDLVELPYRVYDIEFRRTPENTGLLAGGLHNLGGRRSDSYAHVALYDIEANHPVWEIKEAKSQPFEKVVTTGVTGAALLPSNFTRAFEGVLLFNMVTGEEIVHLKDGSILDVGTLGNQFLTASYPNRVSVYDATGKMLRQKDLPYDEEGAKKIKMVFGIDETEFLAAFSDVKTSASGNGEMQYWLERWKLEETVPVWREACCSDDIRRMDQHFLCWDDDHRTKKVLDVFSAEGRVRPTFHIKKSEAKTFVPLDDREFVMLSPKGTLLVDAETGKGAKLKGDAASDYGLWSVASYRPGTRELVVGHVSHFNNPTTRIQRWRL